MFSNTHHSDSPWRRKSFSPHKLSSTHGMFPPKMFHRGSLPQLASEVKTSVHDRLLPRLTLCFLHIWNIFWRRAFLPVSPLSPQFLDRGSLTQLASEVKTSVHDRLLSIQSLSPPTKPSSPMFCRWKHSSIQVSQNISYTCGVS